MGASFGLDQQIHERAEWAGESLQEVGSVLAAVGHSDTVCYTVLQRQGPVPEANPGHFHSGHDWVR